MKKIKIVCFLLVLFTDVRAQIPIYPGTNLRGQVIDQWNRLVPGVRVDLVFFDAYVNRWQLYQTSYAQGGMGLYFFNGIPPGRYGLQVNGRSNYLIDVVPIDYRFQQFQRPLARPLKGGRKGVGLGLH